MEIKELMLKNENNLSKHACFDKDAIRLDESIFVEDIRPNYFRDTDRIIHSASYARYMDKTQVFSKKKNDHITKRMIHVQLVSKIGRTIGRALSLNEDLIEAGALGGKLLGAGAGGFLVFYVNEENQEKVKNALSNLLYVPFKFENQGSTIVYQVDEFYNIENCREK